MLVFYLSHNLLQNIFDNSIRPKYIQLINNIFIAIYSRNNVKQRFYYIVLYYEYEQINLAFRIQKALFYNYKFSGLKC